MVEQITNILVPVDFSPHADRAFGYGTTIAQRFGARLVLLHVVEDPFVTGAWSPEIYVPNVPELLQDLMARSEHQLLALKEQAVALGLDTETVVTTGRPAHSIVEHAEQGHFDLVVMGTHGRTGLSHAVMGSVAERVARRVTCPVMTVRARATAEPVPPR